MTALRRHGDHADGGDRDGDRRPVSRCRPGGTGRDGRCPVLAARGDTACVLQDPFASGQLARADYIGLHVTDRLTLPGWSRRRSPSCPGVTMAAWLLTGSRQILINDAADPRLADYVRLTDVQLRRSLEAAEGLFIAEGEKVIRRAIAAGYPVRSLLVAEDKLATIEDLAISCAAPTAAPARTVPARASRSPARKPTAASSPQAMTSPCAQCSTTTTPAGVDVRTDSAADIADHAAYVLSPARPGAVSPHGRTDRLPA